MKISKRFIFPAMVVVGCSLLPALPATSQSYPTRPITLIVASAPGGGNDIVARVIADSMSKTLGQRVIVENRIGAGGTIGMLQVAKSQPNGYILGLGTSATLAISPAYYPNAGYDPRRDFAPVGLIAISALVLIAHPSAAAQSIQAVIALAKKEPSKLNYASGGTGTPAHLAGELFANMAGINITHIPYKGAGPALTDLLGGHVPMLFISFPPAIGHIRSGKVNALAVTSRTRSKILPNIPTLAESGLPDFEAAQHYGIITPAGTPTIIIAKLNETLREALASEEVEARFANEGAEPMSGTPEEYAIDIDREHTKWSNIIKRSGAKPKQ